MHLKALTQDSCRLFPKLTEFSDFYLAGGTALALQIGHRVSVDFDLFTEQKIKKSLLRKVEKVFAGFSFKILVNNPDELTIFVDNVKVTFLYYPFSTQKGFVEHKGIKFLKTPEIAATKAYTIGRRGEYKDYVDLYFILQGNYSTLGKITRLAEKKYKENFNGRLFLEQLTYLEDIEDAKIEFLDKKVSRKQLAAFLKQAVKEFEI